MTTLVYPPSAQDEELATKRRILTALEAELVQREMQLSTLQARIQAFELRYMQIVGPRLAMLDQVRARISELLAMMSPADPDIAEAARQARSRADQSAHSTSEAEVVPEEKARFEPSENLKALFRHTAKKLHPDLAENEEQRVRRTHWMAEANAAYRAGDVDRLRAILNDWEEEITLNQQIGNAEELVRLDRKIASIQKRLADLEVEMQQLRLSELSMLMERVESAAVYGRNLLDEMVAQVNQEIQRQQSVLDGLLDEFTSRKHSK